MLSLIEFELKDLPTALAVVAAVALLVGYFVRGVRKESGSVKDETINELKALGEIHKEKIEQLSQGLQACKAEHEACERRINNIVAFNLRLQAREQQYQKTINRLEGRLGMDPTDFSDVIHGPEDPDFG